MPARCDKGRNSSTQMSLFRRLCEPAGAGHATYHVRMSSLRCAHATASQWAFVDQCHRSPQRCLLQRKLQTAQVPCSGHCGSAPMPESTWPSATSTACWSTSTTTSSVKSAQGRPDASFASRFHKEAADMAAPAAAAISGDGLTSELVQDEGGPNKAQSGP